MLLAFWFLNLMYLQLLNDPCILRMNLTFFILCEPFNVLLNWFVNILLGLFASMLIKDVFGLQFSFL